MRDFLKVNNLLSLFHWHPKNGEFEPLSTQENICNSYENERKCLLNQILGPRNILKIHCQDESKLKTVFD